MFMRKISNVVSFATLVLLPMSFMCASDSFELRYEGLIGGMADARLCYDAPFSFSELRGIQWFLGLEESGNYSCLTGTHPEAQSSLWQISPNGLFWGKRQGFEFVVVSTAGSGKWGVIQTLEFPDAIDTPGECLMWMGNEGLFVVQNNQLWNSDFDGNWAMASTQVPDLSAYRSRGFVQSQNFVYSWSDEAGILIDKRTSQIVSFEEDGWPEMLADFEIPGAKWKINGDYVQVVNGEEMMQFDFGGKSVLPHQLIFSLESGVSYWTWLFSGAQSDLVRSLLGWTSLAIFVIAGIVLVSRRLRKKPRKAFNSFSESRSKDFEHGGPLGFGFSDSFLVIVNHSSDVITMEEFDQLAHGGENLSPESQRARRSKLFREVNAESKLVMGYDLLVRERDPQDRRKVRYRIQSLPPRIQRIVQAMKADVSSLPVEKQVRT